MKLTLTQSMLAYLALVVLLCWLVAGAEAQTLPVNVVIVKHRFATPLQQTQLIKLGLARLTETGISHPINKLTIVTDSLNKNSIKQYTSRLDSWTNLAYKKGWCVRGQRCHFSLPPVFDAKGIDYGGGVAMGACTVTDKHDSSFSIQRMMNGKRLARIQSSITSAAHENGHNDGAEHDEVDRPYIMHPDALKYGEVRLPWSTDSKMLIDACLFEEKIRPVSKYGFGRPKFMRVKLSGKISEPLRD